MTDVAKLVFSFDATSAKTAKQEVEGLEQAADRLEKTATRTKSVFAGGAFEQARSSAGAYQQSLRGLVGAYEQGRDALGRFTKEDGSFRLSQEATAKMLLQNANAAKAYAREQDHAAKVVAKAEAEAAREASTTFQFRSRMTAQRAQEESQAAKVAQKAIEDADRAAERSAQQVTAFRMRMARQRAAEEVSASQEQARAAQLVAAAEERAAATTASYAAKVAGLKAQLDPFAAVQQTLAQRTKLLDDAMAKGAISAEQHSLMLAKVNTAAKAGAEQIARYGSSAKQTTQLMGQLAPQINDVVTGVLSGQKPFQILAQQGGQIYQALQMGPGGVGGSLKALSGLLNPVTVGVAALGVAFGGLAIAAYDAEKRTASFSNLAKGVGQDLGLSGDQLQALAATSAAASKASIRDAEDWTQAYVRMGVASTDVLGRAVTDTKALARAMAVDGKDAAELLGAALADPISSLDALAKKTGGFDEALKENITSLARHGDLAQADALILGEVEKRSGGAASGVNSLSGAYDSLTTSIGNYLRQAAKVVFTNPGQMQVAQTYSGFGYNPILQNAADAKATAARDNRNDALGSAARSAFDSLLPKVQQIKVIQDKQTALQNALDAAQKGDMGALAAANLTTAQARDAIKAGSKQIADLQKDKGADKADRAARAAANRAIRADNRGDNAIEQAKAAELTAQLATTRNVEQIAGIKAAQIAQELNGQKVRLAGQVEEKRVNDADAKAALAGYERAAAYKRQALDFETANQIAQRDLQQREEVLSYSQRVAQLQAAAAPTLEKSFAIQNKALSERQAYDREALQEAVAQRVMSGEITLTRGKLLLTEQRIAQAADAEDQDRQKRLAIFSRDLELAQAATANQVDILNSRKGLAQSSYAAAQIERQILNATYAAERDRLSKIIANKDTDAVTLAISQDRLATIEEIHRNELRQLELSDNAVTAYADLVGALSNAARSVIDGDIGGSISAAGGVLRQLSGLTGSSALATAASYAGPIGAAVSAVTGVLGAIGDRSAAKAQAKIDRLTKAVDDLRTDNKTSSGSIAAALSEANANWNSDLEYSSAMLTSLRSIDAKTGAVASLIARQIGSGGLLNTKGLGLGSTSSQGSLGAGLLTGAGAFGAIAGGTGLLMGGFAGALALGPMGLVAGAVGALVGALMKTKTTTEVLDQGLTFAAASFDDIAKNGVSGSQYADLLTTTKKSLLGVGLSTKVNTSTVTSGIDPGLLGQISETIGLIGEGVLSAAAVFGVEAAKAAESALGSAVVDLGKLSLKDLKPTEIAEVLQATFDKVGDQLAAAGVPGLDDLANVGEGAFETLTRLAREYEVVDVALNSIGKAFGAVGLASIAARDDLIKAFGGADAFTSATSFFGQNFLTDAERLAPVIKAVNDNLKDYGLSAESSRDQFKSLVLAQDLTTEAGRNTYAMLMGLAPAFDKVASATEAQGKAVLDKRTSIQDQIDQLTLSSADLLSKTRAKERAEAVALNPALGDLIDKLYGLQDAAAATAGAVEAARQQQQIDTYLRSKSDEAMQAATAAQEAYTSQLSGIADAATSAAHALDGAMKSLTDFADSLKAELGLGTTGGGLEQAKRAFNTAVATGNYAAIPELGRAYADAAKNEVGGADYLQILAQIRQASLNSATAAKSSAYQSSLSKQLSGAYYLDDDAMAAEIRRLKAAGLPAAANGGSFTVGGNGGVDNNMLSINGVPKVAVNQGEVVSITPPGRASNDNGEMAALRAQVARLEAVLIQIAGSTAKTATHTGSIDDNIDGVTEGGTAMKTENVA